MAYNKEDVFKEAVTIAKEKNCFFIEQLVSFLPISKKTFYEWFPIGSNESDEIKDIIDKNKVHTKTEMFNDWFNSKHPTLQVSLMKLICTNEERKKLSMTYTDITSKGESISVDPFKQIRENSGIQDV